MYFSKSVVCATFSYSYLTYSLVPRYLSCKNPLAERTRIKLNQKESRYLCLTTVSRYGECTHL